MAIAGIGSGALARLVGQSSNLKSQIETLSAQVASGRRGTYYGEIAPDARRAISLRTEITRRDSHVATIDRALGTTGAAQEALQRLSDIAKQFMTEAGKVNNSDSVRVSALASSARQAVEEVAGLLNERHAGAYVFGGADSANPPIPNPAGIMGTQMATDIATAVGTLAPGNSGAVLNATLTAAQNVTPGQTPFSDYALDPARGLNEPRRTVLTGDGQEVETGLFASRNAAAGANGSATGSWSRDLLRGLMTLASLTPGQTAAGADFNAVVQSATASLKTAMGGLGEEAGALGLAESQLESARDRHTNLNMTLGSQLSDVEEVDLATTLTALQDTQTRLQASWQALSMLSGLSLTDFLR